MKQNRAVKPILSRIFQGLFFASFIWIYVSIIFTNSGYMPWLSALLGIFFLAAGIGVAYFCNKIVAKWKTKTIHIIFSGISIIILGILFYFGFSLKASYNWDIDGVYRASISSILGNPDTSYLAMCPNNIFLYLVLKGLYKIVYAITGSTSTIFAIILNIILIYITIVFIYLIANKLWGAHIGLLTAIICLFFAPFYTYASQYYTDTFALPFVVIPIYLYLCAVTTEKCTICGRQKSAENESIDATSNYKTTCEKKYTFFIKNGDTAKKTPSKKYINLKIYALYCSAGIILALGLKMKGSVAIILVAIILHLFLSTNIISFLKKAAVILASFLIVIFSFNAAVKGRIFSPELQEQTERPYTHYIMMGLRGNGGYSGEDSDFTASFTSQQEKKEANIEEIKKRIADFGFWGMLNHLTNKAVHNTWGDGTYTLFGEGSATIPQTDSKLWLFLTAPNEEESNTSYYNIFYYYSQGFHLAILTLLMISLGIGIKSGKIDGSLLFKIALFGLFLFLLIWETRARYIYSFTPLLLLIASDTCNQLVNINFKKIKEKLFTQRKGHKKLSEL